MPYLELALDVFLTLDGNKILYFPELPLVSRHLSGSEAWTGFIHGLQWCPLGSRCLQLGESLSARGGWMNGRVVG